MGLARETRRSHGGSLTVPCCGDSRNGPLSRLSQGTYGICAQCGRPIHPDRLAILPDTRLCIHCAQAGVRV
jgi:hypothetical protein